MKRRRGNMPIVKKGKVQVNWSFHIVLLKKVQKEAKRLGYGTTEFVSKLFHDYFEKKEGV